MSTNESEHAIWLNTIDRAVINSGQLEALIDAGVVGVVSRPQAFTVILRYRDDYNELLRRSYDEGATTQQMVEALIFDDLQRTADLLHPVFERSEQRDGYVTLPVAPRLADDYDNLVAEGLRLSYDIDRANVMVQVTATPMGVRAIEGLVGDGVSVHATAVVTPATYEAVAEAYLAGMEAFIRNLEIWRVTPASVAAVPIAQIDKAVNAALKQHAGQNARALQGKIGRAVARVIYDRYEQIFSGQRWEALAEQDVRPQRPLWADALLPRYPHTVNSLSALQINAYLAQGTAAGPGEPSLAEAEEQLAALRDVGIDLAEIETAVQQNVKGALSNAFRALNHVVAEQYELMARTPAH